MLVVPWDMEFGDLSDVADCSDERTGYGCAGVVMWVVGCVAGDAADDSGIKEEYGTASTCSNEFNELSRPLHKFTPGPIT